MRDEQRTTTSEDSGTQLLTCETLSLAISGNIAICFWLHSHWLYSQKSIHPFLQSTNSAIY